MTTLEMIDPRSLISWAEDIIHTVRPGDGVIEHYERALYQLSSLLHPGNYLVLDLKKRLALLYGNIFPHTITRYKLKNNCALLVFVHSKSVLF